MEQHMATQEETMRDAQGRLVPISLVKPIDRKRDALVHSIVDSAKNKSEILAQFKRLAMAAVEKFVEESAAQHKVKLGGRKGNITLMSFDGSLKVQLAVSDRITFDEKLIVAKQLIDDCIHKWTRGSDKKIEVLINHAFEVDKKGSVNTDRILGLRKLNINDAKWKQAMDVIGESVQIADSKRYIRIYQRKGNDSYEQINLDLAAL
jgi:hypothetical protein